MGAGQNRPSFRQFMQRSVPNIMTMDRRVIDINTEMRDSVFNVSVSKQNLDSQQVADGYVEN
jgi:S-adenosylmethionine:diacylglycerol 3-amino-3-carboxypropyl transferase